MSDFKSAFATVGPSMQRGFQLQVEKMNWDDVGGLEDVKKVNTDVRYKMHVSDYFNRD